MKSVVGQTRPCPYLSLSTQRDFGNISREKILMRPYAMIIYHAV